MKLNFANLLVLAAMALSIATTPVFAQQTAFGYQGKLNAAGSPANGSYDLTFAVYGVLTGGSPVAGPVTNTGINVSNGLFTVTLDFGSSPFSAGAQRWLEISARTNGGASFTLLSPRQQVLSTPYAITAANLTGTVGNAQLANNSITVNAGTGLSGGGTVALGGSTTLNNAGVLSVTGNSDITATTSSGAVTLGDTATNADIGNTIVKRDVAGNFSTASISLDQDLFLPQTTTSAGAIYSGGQRLIHSYGVNNFFAGQGAGNFTMTGGYNTGLGFNALAGNASGDGNTGLGLNALVNNTRGEDNTAVGLDALAGNSQSSYNTAVGAYSLQNDTNGNWDTAVGFESLAFNTDGSAGVGVGYQALYDNTTGNNNTAVGFQALENNSTGDNNTAVGTAALVDNLSGDNTAVGESALSDTTSGGENTGLGAFAGYTIQGGSGNIAIGVNAGDQIVNGNNNIDIGNSGFGDESGVIRIGTLGTHTKAVFLGIYGMTVGGSAPVIVNANGLLGTVSSSRRFKEDIQTMGERSDELLSLKPVTFRYKPEYDPDGYPQFGLIAEDVEKVDPDLVLRDRENKVYSVRYEAVNAMLLNEFLKEHKKVETQSEEIQDLKARLEKVEELLETRREDAP